MSLTIPQAFGSGAEISGGNLVVPLASLAGTGLSKASPSASELQAALIKLWRSATSALADDPEVGVTVEAPSKSITNRGGLESQINWLYLVNVFTPDTTDASPDPDEVIG